jgi:hypothetical protein
VVDVIIIELIINLSTNSAGVVVFITTHGKICLLLLCLGQHNVFMGSRFKRLSVDAVAEILAVS